jgi:uncharacterized protein (AIM24 family)
MAVPGLVKTLLQDEKFAGLTYHVQGDLVPMLQIELGSMPVYFVHHILLWKDPAVEIRAKSLKGMFKRMMAGMPMIMTEAKGPGNIAFSFDCVGKVFPIHLKAGESIDVREHQFLAATDNIDFTFTRVQGVSNLLLGGSGFFIDSFQCTQGEGILWLYGYGSMFEVNLNPGEQIDLEPGSWVYKDKTVKMETIFQKLSSGFLASNTSQLVFNRFTGPGRVGMQSLSLFFGGE